MKTCSASSRSKMLRRCIKTLLLYILYAIVAFVIGIYVQVPLCDV